MYSKEEIEKAFNAKYKVKNPGSKGGIGYHDEKGIWHYGVKSEKEHEKLSWENKEGKFHAKSFGEWKKDNPSGNEDSYKKAYKKAYTEFYNSKADVADVKAKGGVPNKEPEKTSTKPKTFEDVDPFEDKPKPKNVLEGTETHWKPKTETNKTKPTKLDWQNEDGKFNAKTYGELKKDYPELTQDEYKTMYKKSYTEYYKSKSDKSGESKKPKTNDKPKEEKPKEEKPKEEKKKEPKFIENEKIAQGITWARLFMPKMIDVTDIKNDKYKDSKNESYNVHKLDPDPNKNIDKVVYWQTLKDGNDYKLGTIIGYDAIKKEYKIKGHELHADYEKSRPESVILELRQVQKKPNPNYVPPEKKLVPIVYPDSKIPNFTQQEAKKHIKEQFKSFTDESQHMTGVTILHDSKAMEDMKMRIRKDVEGNHYVEFKLRDENIKDEFKKQFTSKNSQEEFVTWKSKDGNKYDAKQYKQVMKMDDKTTVEYFDKGNDSYFGGGGGYALKDTVIIKTKTKDPVEAYEKALEYLKSNEKISKIVTKSEDDDIVYTRNMAIYNQLSPKLSYNESMNPSSKETVQSEVNSVAKKSFGEDWQERTKYVEVGKGHSTFVIEGAHKKYVEEGFNFVWQGVDKADPTASILKNGAFCSTERHKQGIIGQGASCHSDYGTGGAEYVFTRVGTKDSENSSFSGYGSGNYQVVYRKEIMDRTDWFGYHGDKYGVTNPVGDDSYQKRDSTIDFIKKENKNFNSDNEVMFKKSIAPKYIDKIIAQDDDYAKKLYSSYKETYGTTKTDDGRDISEIIVIKNIQMIANHQKDIESFKTYKDKFMDE